MHDDISVHMEILQQIQANKVNGVLLANIAANVAGTSAVSNVLRSEDV